MSMSEKELIVYERAIDLGKRMGFVRVSLLQRHLGLGYTAATRIITQMIESGLVVVDPQPNKTYKMKAESDE